MFIIVGSKVPLLGIYPQKCCHESAKIYYVHTRRNVYNLNGFKSLKEIVFIVKIFCASGIIYSNKKE